MASLAQSGLKAPASLKGQNARLIWAVVAVDALALAAFAYPTGIDDGILSARSVLKLLGAGVVSVIVLLLTSLLPSDAKAVLVFWRLRDALPGHRAFTEHAGADARVNVDALRRNVGAFPGAPKEQNALWYKLFKKVESDPAVAHANKHYLLFRDLAVLSLVLGIIVAGALLVMGMAAELALAAAAFFMVQYAATAIAARNEGTALVRNVLALHSVKRR